MLKGWADLGSFEPSISQMSCIYEYLSRQMDESVEAAAKVSTQNTYTLQRRRFVS